MLLCVLGVPPLIEPQRPLVIASLRVIVPLRFTGTDKGRAKVASVAANHRVLGSCVCCGGHRVVCYILPMDMSGPHLLTHRDAASVNNGAVVSVVASAPSLTVLLNWCDLSEFASMLSSCVDIGHR